MCVTAVGKTTHIVSIQPFLLALIADFDWAQIILLEIYGDQLSALLNFNMFIFFKQEFHISRLPFFNADVSNHFSHRHIRLFDQDMRAEDADLTRLVQVDNIAVPGFAQMTLVLTAMQCWSRDSGNSAESCAHYHFRPTSALCLRFASSMQL